jgi:hypothetical protein
VVELATGAGYMVALFLLVVSLFLRVLVRRRFRPTPLALTAAAIGLFLAVLNPALQRAATGDLRFLTLAVPLLAVLLAPLPLFLWRGFSYTLPQIRLGGVALLGVLLADLVFKIVLGSYAAGRFAVVLDIGDMAALLVIVAAAIVYLRHREETGAFAVWPVVALVAGLILRFLVTTQGALADLTEGAVSTGLGEVLLAAIFGALAGEAAILAKRIWIDRDPEARLRAIRVRGALLILHGISPVLILLFVVASLQMFAANAGREMTAAAQSFAGIAQSAERIVNEAIGAKGRLLDQRDRLQQEAEAFREQLRLKSEELTRQFDAFVESSKQAAGRVATEAAQQTTAILKETGEKIAGALTPPPLDLGFAKINLPDLGIGKAMGGLIESLLPDLDFGGIFAGLVQSVTTSIEREFAAPRQEAMAMINGIVAIKDDLDGKVRDQAETLHATASQVVSTLEEQMDSSFANARRILVNLANVFYHLLVLVVMLIFAVLAWLLWRAINGLVVMLERVERGWDMITTGKEATPVATGGR